ncbi:uncharacterized protein G2W53_029272 [Senna tora]|uniref:Uncharacterized protein n=1 Tax=Senna tora TaxID=362788 RepID=A0A834T2P3_9FABA|nr:uncharacterized protein G2W53_029272 [Senna tora]
MGHPDMLAVACTFILVVASDYH